MAEDTTTVKSINGLHTHTSTAQVIVLGAGIIGLTAARALLQQGFPVTVIGKHVPGDTDIFYASAWAGACWSPRGASVEERGILAASLRHLRFIAKAEPASGVRMVKAREFHEKDPELESKQKLWHTSIVTNFQKLLPKSYSSDFEYACEYDTAVVDPAIHLQWLKDQIEMLSGIIIQRDVKSLDQLYETYPYSTIFVNASGLGSKDLVGVQDTKCFPDRGQNTLISSDDTQTMYFRVGDEYSYVIPRPMSNILVCGGIHQPHNVTSLPDMDIASTQIYRTNKLAPEVISKNPKISSYVVGIRPGREGGYRLEYEERKGNLGAVKHLLHAYGHDHNGYSMSYGTAEALVKMVQKIEFDMTAGRTG